MDDLNMPENGNECGVETDAMEYLGTIISALKLTNDSWTLMHLMIYTWMRIIEINQDKFINDFYMPEKLIVLK